MKLRKLGATATLFAMTGVLAPGGCSKPAPPPKSYDEMIAAEIRALEKLRVEETSRYKAEGKSDAQIKWIQDKIDESIAKLKNPPPPPPPDDVPPPEPEKKGPPADPEKKGPPQQPEKKDPPPPEKKG